MSLQSLYLIPGSCRWAGGKGKLSFHRFMFHVFHLACCHPALVVSTLWGRFRLTFPFECPVEPHIEKTSVSSLIRMPCSLCQKTNQHHPRVCILCHWSVPWASTTPFKACARVVQPGIRCAVETRHLWVSLSLWRRMRRTGRRHTLCWGVCSTAGSEGRLKTDASGLENTHTHTHTHDGRAPGSPRTRASDLSGEREMRGWCEESRWGICGQGDCQCLFRPFLLFSVVSRFYTLYWWPEKN